MHTPDLAAENFRKLAALFPNAVTETITGYGEDGKPIIERAIDADVLRQEIAAQVVEGAQERYQFTWPDKKKSVVLANQPIAKTLRLVREKSVGRDGTPGSIDTENIYIEGDNLDALKLLQETYLGKVKMIYIDPPYNTGGDFIYSDDFSQGTDEYLAGSGQFDDEGNRLVQNMESNGRFHTDWLNMLYPRLRIAKDFLTHDGIIFISIDDNEVNDLMKICNEIFGKDCFLACFPRVTKKAGKTTDAIAKNHDYVLAYSKSAAPLFYLPSHTDEGFKYTDEYVKERGKYKLNQTLDYDSLQYSASLDYPITIDGETIYPGQSYEKYLERQKGNHARADWAWRWSKELFEFGYKNGFVVVKKYDGYSRIYTKTYQNAKIVKGASGFQIEYFQRTKAISSLEFVENEFSNDNSKKNLLDLFESSVFDYSKPTALLQKLVQYSTSDSDCIMDFFSGSATTAHAVIRQNSEDKGTRSFIMVQLPERCADLSDAKRAGYSTICEIGEERIRRAGKKIREESPLTTKGLDTGFRVFRVDSSNMKDVFYRPNDFQHGQLSLLADNIKEDRTPEDLLFQVMLDLGVLLSSKIEETNINGKKVFSVADGYLIACFDKDVTDETVKAIAKKQPFYAVFRDAGIASDSVMTNFEQIFETYSPRTQRKVL